MSNNIELSWRDIFDSQKVFPSDFYDSAEIAKSVGYSYFCFNGRIYSVNEKSVKNYITVLKD